MMENINNHSTNTKDTKNMFNNNDNKQAKADRKRDMKNQAKTTECVSTTATTTKTSQNGSEQTTATDEEDEETETANKGKTATENSTTRNDKRIKTTETDECGFSTTSESNQASECNDSNTTYDESTFGFFSSVGERLANLYSGTLISNEPQNGRGGSKGLRFRCSNMHEFTISFEKLNRVPTSPLTLDTCKSIWCVKCHNFYQRIKKRADTNGAVVTSNIFDPGYVHLNCRMNHNFKISIHRNPDKVWCSLCKKDVKNESKKQKELEAEIKRQEDLEKQKKLFEESKQYCQDTHKPQITLEDILTQVHLKAQYETQKFIGANPANQDETSVYQIYKIIYMPSSILQASFQKMGEGLNSCFRKMAVLIHPDKNSHPLAKQAFQKLSEVFHECH